MKKCVVSTHCSGEFISVSMLVAREEYDVKCHQFCGTPILEMCFFKIRIRHGLDQWSDPHFKGYLVTGIVSYLLILYGGELFPLQSGEEMLPKKGPTIRGFKPHVQGNLGLVDIHPGSKET